MSELGRFGRHFGADLYLMLVTYLPGKSGQILRTRYWRKRLKHLGKNVRIDAGVEIHNPQFISIDDNAWLDRGVLLIAGPDDKPRPRRTLKNPAYKGKPGEITIGKNVHMGPHAEVLGTGGVAIGDDCAFAFGVKFFSLTNTANSDDDPENKSFRASPRCPPETQFMIEGPIQLDYNVVAAADSIFMPGVHIERDVAAYLGTVFLQSVPENSIMAGSPARRLRDRYEAADKAAARLKKKQ